MASYSCRNLPCSAASNDPSEQETLVPYDVKLSDILLLDALILDALVLASALAKYTNKEL